MKTTIENITPQMADDILAKQNTSNRPQSESYARSIAADIRAGQFLLTHQGIAFDEDDILLDGQTRLRAIVLAGIAVPMVVSRGIPRSQKVRGGIAMNTFEVIDSNRPRKTGHMLHMAGIPNGNKVAALERLILWLVHDLFGKAPRVTTTMAHRINEDIGDSIQTIHAASRSKAVIKTPAWMVSPVVFWHTFDPEAALDFMRELTQQTGPQNSPSRAIARWAAVRQLTGAAVTNGLSITTTAILHQISGKHKIEKLYGERHAGATLTDMNPDLKKKLLKLSPKNNPES